LKILIKIGGTLVDNEASRQSIAAQLCEIGRRHHVVAVHGGGKQLTGFLEARGIASRFVRGLRVSDEGVVDAVTKVIAGSVNKHVVSAIIRAGTPAVGLSGVDGSLTLAAQLDPVLGWVGKPLTSDGRILDVLLAAGYLPVVACLAGDREGNIYNVNADQMAASCAIGWRAERLIFLTDVEGVKDAHGHLVPQLTCAGLRDLIHSGVAHGGMQAKLEAAAAALAAGLPEAIIAGGHQADICLRLLEGEPAGTCISAGNAAAEVSGS